MRELFGVVFYKSWRWMNKAWASLFGYFWLPCPICGREFGGHEIAPVSLMYTASRGVCVCKRCTTRAAERNVMTALSWLKDGLVEDNHE